MTDKRKKGKSKKVNTGGGDYISRDKRVTGGAHSVVVGGNVSSSTIITGDGNTVSRKKQNIFLPVYQAIEQADLSPQEKEDLATDVEEIEGEIVKADDLDESFLARRMRSIKRMTPEIFDVMLSALSGPGAVLSTVVKKVAEKVKAESG